MTDQTIPGVTDEDRRLSHEWAANVRRRPGAYLPEEQATARVILNAISTPPRPTLADMTEEERAECQWMLADVNSPQVGDSPCVIINITDTGVMLYDQEGLDYWRSHNEVTPRPDLPRLTWPGDKETAPVADPVPPNTLAVGSMWHDVDALTLACKESERDQITVIDCDGDVSVWGADARWWEMGLLDFGFEPYTIIHAGKKADQ